MSNEMISVPRELLDDEGLEAIQEWAGAQDQKINIGQVQGDFDEHIESTAGYAVRLMKELRALLAKPAEQNQGEPVAKVEVLAGGGQVWTAINTQWLPVGSHSLYTLPAEQPAPVAVVLPKRPHASEEEQQGMTEYEIGLGHGACEMWDEVKRLNPPQQ